MVRIRALPGPAGGGAAGSGNDRPPGLVTAAREIEGVTGVDQHLDRR